ncbi:nicotinamidase-related amidase [Litorimonas taeanensis]|uniref:Nicotinamidase-related amidase n=1 Tax=Litorimonas taeanensis TaxID=568099 RepID=A0A420WLQ8_9PROT|nr:isochorismatase family protein [Litorimonas taeanensis]RKQ71954.1 nicotinamidase-related amidase [Litorimonas taeanensis]
MKTESTMTLSDKTARQIFEEVRSNPARKRFGFGERMAIVNVDPQKSYTRPDLFKTGYVTDPEQMSHINALSKLIRSKGLPVIWTHVAYMENAADCGIWGTRTDTPDSLQNIKFGSERAEFDDRLEIHRDVDAVYTKRMPSAFFETPLNSFLNFHKIDTVVVTGGSTSGCVRATAVDSLSYGYRTIVPIETTADKHESYHFANLTDLLIKYADVVDVKDVYEWLENYEG